jgi:tetratricopeptide (TPR) repeat protein
MADNGRKNVVLRSPGFAVLVFVAWAVTAGSWAKPNNITPEETALLPSYCGYVQEAPGFNTEGHARWKAIHGEAFHSFHHYCWAIVHLMRADRHSLPMTERRFQLTSALDEIEYVVRHTPSTNTLYPELLTNQGMILRRLDKPRDAIPYLEKAAQADPKYHRAYSEMAKSYLALGDKQRARAALEEGLTHAPEAKLLTVMLNELGGTRTR